MPQTRVLAWLAACAALSIGVMPAAAETWTCRFPTGAQDTRVPQQIVAQVDPGWGTARIKDSNLSALTDTAVQGTFDRPSKVQRKVSWETPPMLVDLGFRKQSATYIYNLVLFPGDNAVLSYAITGGFPYFKDANGRAEGSCQVTG